MMIRSKTKLLPIMANSTSGRLLMPATSALGSLFKNLLCLIIGFSIGIYFTTMWLNGKTLSLKPLGTTSGELQTSTWSIAEVDSLNTSSEEEPADLVQHLFNSTRVLCWIMTNPNNHQTKAIHILRTWGRRCHKLLFMSSQEDEQLHTIPLPVEEGRQHLWDKTNLALKYIYDHHFNDAEWFLKADDDTYVIMENLRYFLYPYPPEAPIYFGCKLMQFVRQGYMSGGAGYVLSKSALEQFATKAFNNNQVCNNTYKEEDLQLGECLANIGVMAGDSRDAEGKERFIPLRPRDIIPYSKSNWYPKLVYSTPNENVTCCSDHAISFHYIEPNYFYVMEYLLYSLRPFGIFDNLSLSLPQKISISQLNAENEHYVLPLSSPPTS
ncbi:glycoprotein-N-acetylgalactosamine 3-beta-galactosyltransferase 1 [Stomoxys calcitrans]|uniref:glycoprotein-N-acetylgalactosamine 3-beta-galactosyltransferase 1 n=1 Tax=Stomoxys calcitrans TaxID=35570 RepID=UPI0027E3AED1|nr:glycoprotein-N-acetylgalactosamine 3-beta-galactosyltransferase 1 [Stomoxys calcitrans]